jgi:hypothetical protein
MGRKAHAYEECAMVSRTLRWGVAALIGVATFAPGMANAQYYGAPYGERGWAAPPPPPPAFDDAGYYDRAGYGRIPPRDRRNYRPYPNRRCDRGTGGTILGAIAGGLIGNAAAGRGDRGVGTVVGAGVGALAGRAIDRDC